MRQEKYKSGAAIKGMAKHNFRAIPTPNANPSKLPLLSWRVKIGKWGAAALRK